MERIVSIDRQFSEGARRRSRFGAAIGVSLLVVVGPACSGSEGPASVGSAASGSSSGDFAAAFGELCATILEGQRKVVQPVVQTNGVSARLYATSAVGASLNEVAALTSDFANGIRNLNVPDEKR